MKSVSGSFLYFICFAISLFFLQSCSFNEFQNPNRIVDISEEIDLQVFPDLHDPSKLKWYIGTKENKYCKDAFIETLLAQDETNLNLAIKGIITPSTCEDLDEKLISLETFDKKENIEVNVQFTEELVSKIQLVQEKDKINFIHDEVDYFSFNQKELHTFDNLTVWAGIDLGQDIKIDDLSKKFEYLIEGTTTVTLRDGNYGYIVKDGKSQLVINPKSFKKYSQNLAFSFEGDPNYQAILNQLLIVADQLKNEFPQASFFIATSQGDIIE